MTTLFDPIRIGDLHLANRIVMAPLTRSRSAPGQVPSSLAVEYYRQRASAGLIVTEGSQVSPEGQGYVDTPGIHSAEQVAGWRRVTDAVHAEGGRIAIQLWHVGRISHVSLQPNGQAPVSSTARRAEGKTFTRDGFVPVSAPRALATEEIAAIVASFGDAARHAMDAGFDGVEVHGANGYLIDQFLRDSINDRTDEYGGAIENRVRFLVEVMQAVAGAIGGGRTGLRLSPVTPSNDAGQDSDPQALFEHAVAALAPLRLAFVEVVEGQTAGARDYAPFDYRRCAVGSAARGWSTTATTGGWRSTPSLRAPPISSRSGARSSPTPTSCAACARTSRSTRSMRARCTAAGPKATPTTGRSTNSRRPDQALPAPP